MSRLPSFVKDALSTAAQAEAAPVDLVLAASGLLDAERRLEALSRAIEAFREAGRGLGIFDEARSGQRVSDAWAKLSRFFLAPLVGGSSVLSVKGTDFVEAPAGQEALGARWDRVLPEVEAFLTEQTELDRLFAETPVPSHVSYKLRTRLLLLDRRAERIKVALDLIRRDLTASARQALEQASSSLEARPRAQARAASRSEDPGGAA